MSIGTDFTSILIGQIVNLEEVKLSQSKHSNLFSTKGQTCYCGVLSSAKSGSAGITEISNAVVELSSFISRVPGASLNWGTLQGRGPDSEMSVDFSIDYDPPLLTQEEASSPQKASALQPTGFSSMADDIVKLHNTVYRLMEKINLLENKISKEERRLMDGNGRD